MEIRTERLHIREFIAADFDAILRYQQEPLYLRYYPWSSRQTGDVSAFVTQQIRNQSVQPRYSFQMVITLRDTGTLIGMRREGHYRQKEWFKGQWWDWLIYAALKEEWQPENGQAASA